MIVAAFVQCIRSVPVVVRAGGNYVSVVNRSQFRASEEFYFPQLLKSYRKKVLRFNHIKCKPPLKPICKLNETADFLKLIVYILSYCIESCKSVTLASTGYKHFCNQICRSACAAWQRSNLVILKLDPSRRPCGIACTPLPIITERGGPFNNVRSADQVKWPETYNPFRSKAPDSINSGPYK